VPDPRPSAEGSGSPRSRRLAAWVLAHDPSLAALKRSVRAAVVVPAAFAIARAVSPNPNVQLFAAFGSFALLLFVDFPGSPWTKLRSLGALFACGAVFIVVGTLCSTQPVAAVLAMAVVGFAVLFAGVLSPLVSAGTIAALLTFVLPIAVAAHPDEIPARLAGWLIAGALAVPAILLVWPRPFHDDLRRHLASTARALAALVAAHADGRTDPAALAAVETKLAELRRQFESTTYPPTGAGPGATALAKLVGRMEWVATNAVLGHQQMTVLELPDVQAINRATADVLTAAAALICDHRACPVHDAGLAERLTAAVVALEASRNDSQHAALVRLVGGATEERAADALAHAVPVGAERLEGTRGQRPDRILGTLDPTFRTRALSFATEMVAEATLEAAGFGRATGLDSRREEREKWGSGRKLAIAHADPRSVWFRNSLRGAIGLALAVTVVEVTDVNHGFWVVLGCLSVLRSNALGTGATALRALAGTVVGFVVGSAIMVGLGSHYDVLWAVLPIAVLLSGVAPTAISFAAGQAGFTVVVVVLFNIIQPTGWKVGLTRIEDVALGSAVSLVVGFLFWPRGATAALGRALGEAYAVGSAYLLRAVERTTSPDDTLDTDAAKLATEGPYDRLDDAFRQYMAERGAKPVSPEIATALTAGAVRTRVEAYSLATLPRRPVETGDAPLASVVTAGGSLRAACADAHRWYLDVAAVLAGRHGTAPPRRQHEGALHEQLVAAFVDSSREHRLGDVRSVLRMLWADESLEDELALQHELAGAVERFAQRRRWAGYDRPADPAAGAPTSGGTIGGTTTSNDGTGGPGPGKSPGQLAGADEPSAI
jgi:uncharacterized membrane protein YccC